MVCAVHVQLLGPVRATVDGDPVALRGRTARTVLARLAIASGSVVSVDQLTDAIWEDDPPLEPSVSVRSIVSRLRKQLGRAAIVTDGAGYRLDPGIVDVDLAAIEATMRDRQLQEMAPEELAAKLGMWVGEPLVDVAWTSAFEPERTRIDEFRARLVDCYYEAMLRCGHAEQCLADLERDAAANPLRESTQLLLMRVLKACSRTADALRAGADYRSRLVEETGLDPSPAYDEISRSLLTTERSNMPAVRSPELSQKVLATRRTWIPPDTPFVGRESELADLARFAEERRLVTITGPGGVGKTRLVTEFLHDGGPVSPLGTEMISLAALDRSGSVETAVSTALGIESSSSGVTQALVDTLAATTSVLVLDNCEHVLASARLLVQSLLRGVESLQIIVTSRRRLGLGDEVILDVGPLFVPNVNAPDSAAMTLFMDRVSRAAPTMNVSKADIVAATDICRLVDGLPLALEIVAPRIPMFGFGGLRQRLADGLSVPSGRVADDDRRQATIESTVEWSLALLSPDARLLFDELSIFPSWFDLDSLEHISAHQNPIELFSEIIDSSLVVIDHGRPAYRLLEPVRQVADRQVELGRREQISDRYLTWIESIIDAIDQYWVDDHRAAAQDLIVMHRADFGRSFNLLVGTSDATSHGRFAYVLARALADRADLELIDLCRVDIGPSLEGELARCILAWHQGEMDLCSEMSAELGPKIVRETSFWSYYNWVRAANCLYQGDVEGLADSASIAAFDERCYTSVRSESVGLWALGLLYSGDLDGANLLLAQNEHILQLSDSGGFVAYTRAEVAAANGDGQAAIKYLAESSRQSNAANATFGQRLTDVSRLILLIDSERTIAATHLALDLIPALTQAGTYPQAWTAMRHVADLLRQLNESELGLLVLNSAGADPSAPAVTGDGIRAEERQRSQLSGSAGGTEPQDQRLLKLAPLWKKVRAILEASLA